MNNILIVIIHLEWYIIQCDVHRIWIKYFLLLFIQSDILPSHSIFLAQFWLRNDWLNAMNYARGKWFVSSLANLCLLLIWHTTYNLISTRAYGPSRRTRTVYFVLLVALWNYSIRYPDIKRLEYSCIESNCAHACAVSESVVEMNQ